MKIRNLIQKAVCLGILVVLLAIFASSCTRLSRVLAEGQDYDYIEQTEDIEVIRITEDNRQSVRYLSGTSAGHNLLRVQQQTGHKKQNRRYWLYAGKPKVAPGAYGKAGGNRVSGWLQ